MTGPRLLLFGAEFPYPPNHGGRSDTWQRLRAFSEAGVDIQLVCWYSDRRGGAPSDAELAVVKAVVRDLVVLPINIGPADLVWRLVNLLRMPSHVSARTPRGAGRRELMSRILAFAPGAIWLDGLWPAAFARYVAARLRLPYFYRSHNIEHRYMARQASLSSSFSYRLRLALTLIGLEAFEQKVLMGAAHVFDISVDDLVFWRGRGLKGGQWLPPIVRVTLPPVGVGEASPGRYDVVFVGNLHTPNNVEGLRWLLREVWPQVRASNPEASALIAGSGPNQEVRALVAQAPGVELQADPVDVWPLYRAARVLVNPVRSGSGVNIKSVEMLQLDQAIVSTSIGAGGLPEEIRRQFIVADTPEAFAKAILCAVVGDKPLVDAGARAAARQAFTPEAIKAVIAVIQRAIAPDHSGHVPQ